MSLRITNRPSFLDRYIPVRLGLAQRATDGGEVSILLEPRRDNPPSSLGIFETAQKFLGEEVLLKSGSWSYSGHVLSVDCDGRSDDLRLGLGDSRVMLSHGVRSQAFSNTTIGEIARSLGARLNTRFRFIGGIESMHVPLAIQYGETDWGFLSRVASAGGGAVWCNGVEVVIADSLDGEVVKLGVPNDFALLRARSTLGVPAVTVTTYPFLHGEQNVEFPARADEPAGLHTVAMQKSEERLFRDTIAITCERGGASFARARASGRARTQSAENVDLYGVLREAVALGTVVSISEGTAGGTKLMITELCGDVLFGDDNEGQWEARAQPWVGQVEDLRAPRLVPAVVEQSGEGLNRVRLRFPWDSSGTTSPWLRVIAPRWGKGHFHYTPPKVGDHVILLLGEYDENALVLGCVAVQEEIRDPNSDLVISLTDDVAIQMNGDTLELRGGASGRQARISLSGDRLYLESTQIEIKGHVKQS